ncbi:MAG: S-layer homology domain-containing protein [Chloroflexia bacterium]
MSRSGNYFKSMRHWLIAMLALVAIVALSVGVASAGIQASAPTGTQVQAKQGALSNAAITGPIVVRELKHDVSPPLRDIPPAAAQPKTSGEREIGRRVLPNPGNEYSDPVVQFGWGPMVMPTPIINIDGVLFATSSCACAPPDTNGDVGPNHYVQTVNTAYQVFSKSGLPMSAPLPMNTLWAGFGGSCQTRNDGDPIVKYDQLADRWVLNQFTTAPPFTQCIAVSTTGDPMGSYHRYAFLQFESATRFGDYQKIGVWPDAYYMSNNEFNNPPTAFLGAGNYAFDRTNMLAGLPASYVYFGLPPQNWGGQQPTDLEGMTLPPAGAPNLFVEIDDSAWDPPNIPTDQLQMWRFHVDFVTPANSTFTALPKIVPPNLANFDGIMCGTPGDDCVPQPGTASRLDSLSDRVMYRATYRNFGSHESVLFNHTVDAASDKVAIRWYELRGISGTPSLFQQSTYDPDTNHHWMGSIAQDNQGNMALGYSVSSSTVFPSVRYSGRLVTDPLNTMPQGEGTIVNGTGSQTGTNGRWGDYSSMNVDPVDDCTFWYTQEYYSVTSAFNWRTRIGSFKFPGCTPPVGATATPTAPIPTATNTVPPTQTPGGPTATPTSCTLQFTDVPEGSTFYEFVRCMACRGIINGYTSGCETGNPCFRPSNNVTRGQLAKIVSNSAGFSDPAGPQQFEDVPPGSTFFDFIWRLAFRGIVSGYPCGGPGEPCVAPDNRPYFRPNADVTRGQLSKIVSEAAGYSDPPGAQQFEDVLPGSTFYDWIWRLADRGIMSGYPCGGEGEPCNPPDNRPYFRPGKNATRGQASKIVANTFYPNCETPSR